MTIQHLSDGDQAVVNTGQLNDEQFKQQISELAQQWQNARDTDLEIRHRTGALLNERYGKPDKRLQRGREILGEVAGQLQVAQSELSRMRRFAFHFTSAEDVKQKHSEVTNWTAVKGLLPKLTPQGKAKGQAKNGAASSKPKASNAKRLKKITQLLVTLPAEFREIQKDLLTEDDREDLRAKFELVSLVVSDCLGASVSPDEVHSENTAPLAQLSA